MILNRDQIKALDIVSGSESDSYRTASYDIRIAKIISPDGQQLDEFCLPPSGVAEVVSLEEIRLPATVSGYAMVKTGLCNEGILAINIGIVDPGYDGPLSSTLINFGSRKKRLYVGQPFLRLTFHECEQPENWAAPKPIEREKYTNDQIDRAIGMLGDMFLNVDSVIDNALRTNLKKLLLYSGILAAAVAIFTFGVTTTVSLTERLFLPRTDIIPEIESLIEDGIGHRQTDIEEKLSELENRLDSLVAEEVDAPPSSPDSGSVE